MARGGTTASQGMARWSFDRGLQGRTLELRPEGRVGPSQADTATSRKGKKRAPIPVSHSIFGHLKFVQNDEAAGWEAWSGLGRGSGKAAWSYSHLFTWKEFGFYPEGHGQPQQGSRAGGDMIRGMFSKHLS